MLFFSFGRRPPRCSHYRRALAPTPVLAPPADEGFLFRDHRHRARSRQTSVRQRSSTALALSKNETVVGGRSFEGKRASSETSRPTWDELGARSSWPRVREVAPSLFLFGRRPRSRSHHRRCVGAGTSACTVHRRARFRQTSVRRNRARRSRSRKMKPSSAGGASTAAGAQRTGGGPSTNVPSAWYTQRVKRALAANLVAVAITACSSPAAPPLASPHQPPPPPPEQTARAQPPPPPATPTLETLHQGDDLHGFRVDAVYLDDADHRIGARFIHDATQLRASTTCASSPRRRRYIWVNTFPTSDKGEPHTQEHLLLGKGDRGRRLGSMRGDGARRVERVHRAVAHRYHFPHRRRPRRVLAGVPEPARRDAQPRLHRRGDPPRGPQLRRRQGAPTARSTSRRRAPSTTRWSAPTRTPTPPLWRAAGQLVYGATHPLALESGGYPDAIRTMTPAGHPRVPRRRLPPREHGHDRRVPVGDGARRPCSIAPSTILDERGRRAHRQAGPVAADDRGRAADPAARRAGHDPARRAIRTPTRPRPGPILIAWPATRQLVDDRSRRCSSCSSTRSPATRARRCTRS